jgi:hypothetical protein
MTKNTSPAEQYHTLLCRHFLRQAHPVKGIAGHSVISGFYGTVLKRTCAIDICIHFSYINSLVCQIHEGMKQKRGIAA